ncbi:MAG: BadF/BadG/BcrA/BcrD ATPase family protein, partial [Thermoplasmata archaeon]
MAESSGLGKDNDEKEIDPLNVGLDIGSTTVKIVVLDKADRLIYSNYKRHNVDIRRTLKELINSAYEAVGNRPITMSATGSGGFSAAEWLSIPFIQEVIASRNAIRKYVPDCDVVIELGGEDAKITYFDKDGGVDQRMNGTCAGGTGAFID